MKEYTTWMLTRQHAAEMFNAAVDEAISEVCNEGVFPENVDERNFAATIRVDEHHSLFTNEYMIDCAIDYQRMFENALSDEGFVVFDQEYCNIWVPRVCAFIKDRLKDLAEAEKELNERLFNQGK